MHGCGHDLHMTGLLGARRSGWPSTATSIAGSDEDSCSSRAEEAGLGARAVDGRRTRRMTSKAIIGTHNNPNYAPGQLAIGAAADDGRLREIPASRCTPRAPTPVTRRRAPAPSRRSPRMILDPADHREPQRLAVPRRWCCPSPKCTAAMCGTWCPPKRDSKGTVRYLRPVGRRTAGPPAFRGGGRAHGRSVRDQRPTWTGTDIQVPLVGDEELVRGGRGRRATPMRQLEADTSQSMAGEDFVRVLGMRGAVWCSRSSARTARNRGAPTGTVRTSSAWTDRDSGLPSTSTSTPRCGCSPSFADGRWDGSSRVTACAAPVVRHLGWVL